MAPTKRRPRRRSLPPSSSIPISAVAVPTINQENIMLIHPTAERLRSLGLAAMADTLIEMQNNPQAAEMPHADWLGLLIDREPTFRDNRRLTRRLTAAKLRQTATIVHIDCLRDRPHERANFQTLPPHE